MGRVQESADKLTQWLDSQVYPHLSHEKVFGHLDEFQRAGSGWKARCPHPSHRDEHPSFSMTDGVPCGHCFSCGHSRSWWSHVEARVGPGRAVIEELARMAGVQPLAGASTPAANVELRVEAERKGELRESVLTSAVESLWLGEGGDVLEYLRSRGYDDELIKRTEIGAWPRVHKPKLKTDFGLDLPGAGKTHRLIIPIRDPVGRVAGFVLRCLGKVPEGTRKYLVARGLPRGSLLPGIHRIGRKNPEPVLVVEGFLDGEILRASGLPAVALGSANMTKEQASILRSGHVSSAILCMDGDEVGIKGTERATELLLPEGSNGRILRVYVSPSLEGLDPDEWVIRHGAESLRQHLLGAAPAAVWFVRNEFGGTDLESSVPRDQALDRVLAFTETLPPVPRAEALKEVTGGLGIPSEALGEELRKRDERRRNEQARKEVERLARQVRNLAGDENVPANELVSRFKQIVRDGEREIAQITLRPARPFAERFEDVYDQLRNWPTGLQLPWALTQKAGITFEAGTFNVVAAQTSAGKTTLIQRALLSWLQTQDKPIVLWSCETTHRVLMARLLAMLATERAEGNREYSMWDVVNHVRQDRLDSDILWAVETMKGLSSRLYHLDDGSLTAETLRHMVDMLARKHGGLTAVICDYLQAMDPSDEVFRSREEEVAQTTKELMRTAVLGAEEGQALAERYEVPVIAAAQFNRNLNSTPDLVPALEHLRESGRIEQSAFVVVGLRNARMAKDGKPDAEEIRKKLGCGPEELEKVPARPYSALRDLEASRLLAQLAITSKDNCSLRDSKDTPKSPTLLEMYVLKNRQRGHVGSVVPLVLFPQSGRIVELDLTFSTPPKTVTSASVSRNGPSSRRKPANSGRR